MVYKVLYKESVEKDLLSIDKNRVKKILNKIEGTLAKDPRNLGKPLKGKFKGLWRYRIGEFRVIYRISESEILILVLKIGHRKDIYN